MKNAIQNLAIVTEAIQEDFPFPISLITKLSEVLEELVEFLNDKSSTNQKGTPEKAKKAKPISISKKSLNQEPQKDTDGDEIVGYRSLMDELKVSYSTVRKWFCSTGKYADAPRLTGRGSGERVTFYRKEVLAYIYNNTNMGQLESTIKMAA